MADADHNFKVLTDDEIECVSGGYFQLPAAAYVEYYIDYYYGATPASPYNA